MDKRDLAQYMDYTILKPQANVEELESFAKDAIDMGVKGACVHLIALPIIAPVLKGTNVKIVSVVGFPFGSVPMRIKEKELEYALGFEVDEVDTVFNLHLFKSGEKSKAGNEIKRLKNLLPNSTVLKVIIETGLLSTEEIKEVSKIVQDQGADFVKTCTGFVGRGVTVEDVETIRQAVGNSMEIKASGGIKTLRQCLALIKAGATRLGLSAAKSILSELDN